MNHVGRRGSGACSEPLRSFRAVLGWKQAGFAVVSVHPNVAPPPPTGRSLSHRDPGRSQVDLEPQPEGAPRPIFSIPRARARCEICLEDRATDRCGSQHGQRHRETAPKHRFNRSRRTCAEAPRRRRQAALPPETHGWPSMSPGKKPFSRPVGKRAGFRDRRRPSCRRSATPRASPAAPKAASSSPVSSPKGRDAP